MTNTIATSSSTKAPQRVLGAICWNELHTRDTKRAADFYTKVVGWTTRPGSGVFGSQYTEWFTRGGQHVGSMMSMPAQVPAGVPSNWAIYINVADVDAAVAKAVKLGARRLAESFDVPTVGRVGVIADPTGAVVHLFQGLGDHGTREQQPEPGIFCWAELLTTDPAAAAKFYAQLLGWSTTVMPMDGFEYTLFWLPGADPSKKSGGVGGMMKIMPDMGPMPSNWLTYIMVDDVDAAAGRVTQHGGRVCCPPTDIPNVGRFTVITDPTGATVALFKNK
jgi:predicted enzyme related to lactoylglutathione lyase